MQQKEIEAPVLVSGATKDIEGSHNRNFDEGSRGGNQDSRGAGGNYSGYGRGRGGYRGGNRDRDNDKNVEDKDFKVG